MSGSVGPQDLCLNALVFELSNPFPPPENADVSVLRV